MARSYTHDGVFYTSLSSLVREKAADGVTYACVATRLRLGWDMGQALSEPVHANSHREYKVGGVTFASLKELASCAGISYEAAVKRSHRGWTDFEIFYGRPKVVVEAREEAPERKSRGEPVIVAGVHYESFVSAYKALGPKCSQNAAKARLRNGWSIEEALEVVDRVDGRRARAGVVLLTIDGHEFNALEASKVFRVPYSTVLDRLARGASDLQAVGLHEIKSGELMSRGSAYSDRPKRERKSFVVDGRSFATVKDLSDAFGLPARLVYNRIREGWTVERAVTESVSDPIEVDGVFYRSAMNAWEKVGRTSLSTYQGRKSSGFSIEVCLGLEPLPQQDRYEAFGVAYGSLSEVAAAHGLSQSTLTSRLQVMPIEDAIKYRPANGRYSKSNFEKDPDLAASIGSLYFVRIRFSDGILHKVGITRRTVAQRLYSHDHDVVLEVRGKLYDVYQVEQKVVAEFSELHYRAEEDFEGRTETFLLTDEEESLVADFIASCVKSIDVAENDPIE